MKKHRIARIGSLGDELQKRCEVQFETLQLLGSTDALPVCTQRRDGSVFVFVGRTQLFQSRIQSQEPVLGTLGSFSIDALHIVVANDCEKKE